MRYETTFQCPENGSAVTCVYMFGRLKCEGETLEDLERLWESSGVPNPPTRDEMKECADETERWCRSVNGRYSSVDEANDALLRAGIDGFEVLSRW